MLIILEQGEELVAVTMGKRDRDNQDSLTEVKDLTSQVSDGRVFVDVPNGLWCVNVIKTTRKGTGRKNCPQDGKAERKAEPEKGKESRQWKSIWALFQTRLRLVFIQDATLRILREQIIMDLLFRLLLS